VRLCITELGHIFGSTCCARTQQVPTAHGKADLTVYRDCGAKVVAVLGAGGPVERASVDEAYIDVSIQVLSSPLTAHKQRIIVCSA
jgi:impB/mucB/samB family